MLASAAMVLMFIGMPMLNTLAGPTWEVLVETLGDAEVMNSIWLSLSASAMAAGIAFVFGTPLAYLVARNEFPGKKVVESLVDLPIMPPPGGGHRPARPDQPEHRLLRGHEQRFSGPLYKRVLHLRGTRLRDAARTARVDAGFRCPSARRRVRRRDGGFPQGLASPARNRGTAGARRIHLDRRDALRRPGHNSPWWIATWSSIGGWSAAPR